MSSLTEIETQEHWRLFQEFATLERQLGGPDPQLDTLVTMSVRAGGGSPLEDAVWRAGCFAATYCLGSAEVIWQAFTAKQVSQDPGALWDWVARNWEGLPLRRERRAVRTPQKLSRCLISYAEWMTMEPWRSTWWQGQNYRMAYKETAGIYGMGRYIQLKLLEALHRMADMKSYQDCLMAKGGWSPRLGLAFLYPEHAGWLKSTENHYSIENSEALAAHCRNELRSRGLDLSWWELQVFLCEYKQAVRGKKYPGRSHDTELAYWLKTQKFWDNESNMLSCRHDLFPEACLGEVHGWMAARPECEKVMVEHGYMWSDLRYDYYATRDFSDPVKR